MFQVCLQVLSTDVYFGQLLSHYSQAISSDFWF